MELFPTQPDLSLQISPPTTRNSGGHADGGETFQNIDRNLIINTGKQGTQFDLSLERPTTTTTTTPAVFRDHSARNREDGGWFYADNINRVVTMMRPITGIPVYHQNTPSSSSSSPLSFPLHQNPISDSNGVYSRFFTRVPGKRSMRAPRMRWTTSLHGRFVHAVKLLGGHESILSLSLLISI